MDIQSLADEISDFVFDALEGFVERFCPDDRLPQVNAGVRVSPETTSALIYLYGLARQSGLEQVAGRSCEARIKALLPLIRGEQTERICSYQLAETLLRAGTGFDDNPLLQDLSPERIADLREALDSTRIYDPETEALRSLPNRDWAVLARCEYARSRLGLLDDPLIMRTALDRVHRLFKDNPMGYMDNCPDATQRFDIATCEQLLCCEAFMDLIDPGTYSAALNAADRLFNLAVLENGAFVAWGSATGARSLTTRIRLAALLLRAGACRTPARTLALAQDAFENFVTEWWGNDATMAYRDRLNEGDASQLLADSIGSLTALFEAAALLRDAAPLTGDAEEEAAELYPEQDGFLRFAPGRGACWFFRNEHWCFQWPLVGGPTSDYMASPAHPTALPQPAHSPMGCGVPQAFYGGERFYPQASPYSVDKQPNGISFSQKRLVIAPGMSQANSSHAFKRQVKADVYANTLQVRETWSFSAELPDVLSFHFAEADVPLEISWQCSSAHHATVVDLGGMPEWRSYWGPITRLHQLDITPAAEIHIAYTITPMVG